MPRRPHRAGTTEVHDSTTSGTTTRAMSRSRKSLSSLSSSSLHEKNKGSKDDAVRGHFQRFDLNGDGLISREEMNVVLSSLDPSKWTTFAIEKLWEGVDKNGDGAIHYDEFCNWVFGHEENRRVADAVNAVSAENHPYLVLEVCNNVCAFLRTPSGALVTQFTYRKDCSGHEPALVHEAGFAARAEPAFRCAKLPANTPLVVLLDAGMPGGNYMPSATFGLLTHSGLDLADVKSERVKFVLAAPTLKTPRACLLASTCLSTRYFLWEFQRACAKHKYSGKVAFIPREALYIGQQTLYETVLADAVAGLGKCSKRNLGAAAVRDCMLRTTQELVSHSKALEAAECKTTLKFEQIFGDYVGFEPDKKGWASAWPPGYGASTSQMLAGHTQDLLSDVDGSVLFELGDGLQTGRRVVDSRAAQTSLETVFLVTRTGLHDKHTSRAGPLLQSMAEDPGVTLWTKETMIAKFGELPAKSSGDTYQQYVRACHEGMDGLCVLDLPVDYWLCGFLDDLFQCDNVSVVLVVDPGFERERYGMNDQSGFPAESFVGLPDRVSPTPVSSVVLLPSETDSNNEWAHAGAFVWKLRAACTGVLVMPAASLDAGWGSVFLATWMSITSATLMQRIDGHLCFADPHNIFVPFYGEGESSAASIKHLHVLKADGPLISTYTVSCGAHAGFRLEALLDKISCPQVFGNAGGEESPIYVQAAGETSDDHGERSLEVGAVRYATVASGGKTLMDILKRCSDSLLQKAGADDGRDADAEIWKDMATGQTGLGSWVLAEMERLRSKIET
eukprot:TRINITY_DN71509_c0_g1_i1.p1 TRINITY_DN71509_c0_g1~~TRINITY_DN71509_c0_g1_i1.p1  ORF type:complete len:788 (+),score=127.26 TRINITY_DN71509_c0_g1_i1:75-2438(+)